MKCTTILKEDSPRNKRELICLVLRSYYDRNILNTPYYISAI
jgi:hypothetical protein